LYERHLYISSPVFYQDIEVFTIQLTMSCTCLRSLLPPAGGRRIRRG
jgi:hypothetical protein